MLIALICLLRLLTTNCYKNAIKFGKKYGKFIELKIIYIKINDDNINKNVQGKKVPKENASYKCLS